MCPGEPTVQRRCLVCRNRAGKASLLRFVIGPEGGLMFDARQRAAGRGLHVCAHRDCVERALSGAFRRGAKHRDLQLPPAKGYIEGVLVPALWRLYREALSMGRASGQLVAGADSVEREARDGRLGAYLLATDASQGTRRKFASNAERKHVPVLGLLSRLALADATGRDNPVVLGWKVGRLGARFADIEAQLLSLGVAPPPLAEGQQGEHGPGEEPDGKQHSEVITSDSIDDPSTEPETPGAL